ncbi:jhy protein homolog isoform 1-T2 [Synchiropus picturatus]
MDMRLKDTSLEATEADTESFVPGRVDQEQLYNMYNSANMGFQNKQGLHQDEDDNDEDDDDLLVSDSLDVTAHTRVKTQVPSGRPMAGGDITQVRFFSDDDYTDLKYDPDWRRKLKGADGFFPATQSSMENAFQNQPKNATQPTIKGGYRYISDSAVTPSNMAVRETDLPYLLHPEPSASLGECNERSYQLQCIERENMKRSHELTQNLRHTNGVYMQEYQNYYRQETQQNQSAPTQAHAQLFGGARYASPKRQQDDIVERNKVTLGRQTDKQGSYMRMHVLRQETALPVKKEVEHAKEASVTLGPSEGSDPETRWLQQTQQLKASQMTRTRKFHRNEIPDLSQPSTSHPLDPLFKDNNFKASSELSSVVPQDTPSAKLSAKSPHRQLYRSPVTKVQFIPEGQQKTLQESFFVCLEGLDKDLNLEKSLELCPSTSSSQASSAYAVLPPIGKVYEESQEMSLRSTQTFSSENIQPTEMQKEEKQRVTYKTYTLKDYKKLLPEVRLQGLGPDYSAVEKTKMKRLRQYSEVIREQNKKISRVPFLVTKDPEGTDKKVPRMKALEYAKTIAKPRLASQAKQAERAPSDGIGELPSSLQDKTAFQLDTLENLRKRHEQEKKTVAHFRKFV